MTHHYFINYVSVSEDDFIKSFMMFPFWCPTQFSLLRETTNTELLKKLLLIVEEMGTA